MAKKKPTKAKAKPAKRQAKRLSPYEDMMRRLCLLVPDMKDAKGDLLESWSLFAKKLLLARRLKTSVNVITVNPQMLEYRDVLQKEFPCAIMSPTEARFGMDSIQNY